MSYSNLHDELELSKVLDKFLLCEKRQIATFTNFYSPNNWANFISQIKPTKATKIVAFGGNEETERKIIGFFPAFGNDFDNPQAIAELFPIKILQIKHNSKFNKPPRHQDYLGAIIGLGLERTKIGDILTGADYAEIFAYSDISDYICTQLNKVGNTTVTAKISQTATLIKATEKILQVNVASMRLDVVLSAIFKLSRKEVSALILAEKAFVNWIPCKSQTKTVNIGDILTLRGYGRAKIGDILGTTKKDRLRLEVEM
ncbi:MAG: YlmH/Sll1252 family protein [Firmicutes bacterium]|nr:YlmH/Sll1252 family protein [Bacillota bacterium]